MRKVAATATVALAAFGFASSQPRAATHEENGAHVFSTYCVRCHGPDAAGCGVSARLYTPRPANLTASWRPPEYKVAIISKGGEAMGRSPFMPPWGGQLAETEILDVVAYLGTLRPKTAPPC